MKRLPNPMGFSLTDFLPIETTLKIRIFKTKRGSIAIEFIPVEEPKEEKKDVEK